MDDSLRPLDELDIHISETIIVFEYLLKYTDEKNFSSQSKILAFCREKYNYEPRRDRIGHILDNLYQRRYMIFEFFNISLQRVQFKNSFKYYLDKKGLSYEEVAKIINSLNSNPLLPRIDKDDLKEKLYKLFISHDLKEDEKADELILMFNANKTAFTRREMKHYKTLKPLLGKQCLIYFKLEHDWYKQNFYKAFVTDFVIAGYLYQIYEFKRNLCVYVVSSSTGQLLTIPLVKVEEIEVVKKAKNERGWISAPEAFKDENHHTIASYLNERHLAISGQEPVEFVFEIRRGNDNYYYTRKEFKNFFHVDFNIIKETENPMDLYNYQTVSIKAEPYVILDFLTDTTILEAINIIKPDNVKDVLRNRLNKLIDKLKE